MIQPGLFRLTRSAGFAKWLTLASALVMASPGVAQRAPVEAKNGIVVSSQDLASQVGVDILKKGGNAVDAAIATGLALAVVFPQAGNIGGGGFMVIHTAAGKDTVIDYRERAPKAATRDMYLEPREGHQGRRVLGARLEGWRRSRHGGWLLHGLPKVRLRQAEVGRPGRARGAGSPPTASP